MSPEAVHAILADLERRATRVSTRGDGRETWRFRVDDAPLEYDLHFYPDDDTALKRYVGGADAAREFTQLQALQKLLIPATRVIANLKGLRLGERKGDACIVVHDPLAVPLDAALRAGVTAHRERLTLLASLIERLESLHRAKLCPVPLTAHGFSMRDRTTLLADGSATLRGGVDADRLAELDASTRHLTTTADRLRVWKHFRDEPPPRRDWALRRSSLKFAGEAAAGVGPFGVIEVGDWSGRFLRRVPLTLPWSVASAIEFSHDDFERALPTLLETADGTVIKSDHAALVIAKKIELAGMTIEVVIKRPALKGGLRGGLQRLGQSRVMRTWLKTWRMLALGLPCEVPLIVLERRRGLRLLEQVFVVERVPGKTLEHVDLDALVTRERTRLLTRCGRLLRAINGNGFRHADAKTANWIAWTDPHGQVKPILLDLDAIRIYGWRDEGYARLRRALAKHPQIKEGDLSTLAAAFRPPR